MVPAPRATCTGSAGGPVVCMYFVCMCMCVLYVCLCLGVCPGGHASVFIYSVYMACGMKVESANLVHV